MFNQHFKADNGSGSTAVSAWKIPAAKWITFHLRQMDIDLYCRPIVASRITAVTIAKNSELETLCTIRESSRQDVFAAC